uniref:Uncharacterized protein n=1 Tax=Cucumis sativus TaxID=3659 RepID=A0A0A0K0D2_CUCSA
MSEYASKNVKNMSPNTGQHVGNHVERRILNAKVYRRWERAIPDASMDNVRIGSFLTSSFNVGSATFRRGVGKVSLTIFFRRRGMVQKSDTVLRR